MLEASRQERKAVLLAITTYPEGVIVREGDTCKLGYNLTFDSNGDIVAMSDGYIEITRKDGSIERHAGSSGVLPRPEAGESPGTVQS